MAKAKLLFSSPVLAHLSKWILSTWWLPKILELFFLLGLLPSFLQIDPVNFTSKIQFKFTQFFQLPHIFSAVVTGLGKSVFIPIPKKGIAKECSNYYASVLISHASKVMLKILQDRLQQEPKNFETYQLGLEKAEKPEIKLPTITGSWRKQGNSRKKIHPLLLHWLH